MALESPSRQTSGHACEGNFWLWLSVGGTISWAGVLDSRRRQAEHHSSYFASWLEMQCTAASHSCYRASPALLDWTPLHCWLYRHSLPKLLLGKCLVIAKAKATDTAWKEVFLSFKWDITFDYEIDSTNNDIDIVLESHRLLHCLTSWLSDAHFLSPPDILKPLPFAAFSFLFTSTQNSCVTLELVVALSKYAECRALLFKQWPKTWPHRLLYDYVFSFLVIAPGLCFPFAERPLPF